VRELQPPDLVREALDVLGVAAHDGRRGQPSETVADRRGLALPQGRILDPETVQEVLSLEDVHRLLDGWQLEGLVRRARLRRRRRCHRRVHLDRPRSDRLGGDIRRCLLERLGDILGR
jgi:hypothetical protein